MTDLSAQDIEEVQDVFDLFDFWDGRDSMVDGVKVGDFLRCCGLNPTQALVLANGGTANVGEKAYKFEDILPIFKAVNSNPDNNPGTLAEFLEAFKTFDREGQGLINGAELRHVLKSLGERLPDGDVDQIFKLTGVEEDLDGNIKYEEFIKRVMSGPTSKTTTPSLFH